jgi:hypothetical protein
MQKKQQVGYLVLLLVFCVMGYLILRQGEGLSDQVGVTKNISAIDKTYQISNVVLSGVRLTFPSGWKIKKGSDSAASIAGMPGVKASVALSVEKCEDQDASACYGSGKTIFSKTKDSDIYDLVSTDTIANFGLDFSTVGYGLYAVRADFDGYKYSAKDIKALHDVLSSAAFIAPNNADVSLTQLNKDGMLNKLFPGLSFKDGKAAAEIGSIPVTLSLKNSREGSFVDVRDKNVLLTVELEDMDHAGGLYHAYLGLFDNQGNLLTAPVKIADATWDDSTGGSGHFGGDEGSFNFYDCKGLEYILAITGTCPSGSCCDDSAVLYRINKGRFETVAGGIKIDGSANKNPWKITASEEGLSIKTVPLNSDNDCPEKAYKDLKWNADDCRFE